MNATIRLLAGAVLAGVLAAASAQEVGERAPDLELRGGEGEQSSSVPLLERYKNRIIVLVFWRSIDAGSVELFPMLNALHENYLKRGVVLIGLTDEKKEKADATYKGKEGKFTHYTGINPEDPYRFPAPAYAYIIDIHGNIAYARFHAGSGLEERIKEVMAKGPPVGADEQSVKLRVTKLAQLLNKGDLGRAYTIFRDLKAVVEEKEGPLAEQLQQLDEQFKQGAQAWLKRARDQVTVRDYKPACRALAELDVRFVDSDIQEEVDREIGRLQGDNNTKEMIRQALDNAEGELRNDDAAALEESRLYLDALEVYREVTEEYEGTEAAKVARSAIERLNSDPAVQQDIQKLKAAEQAERGYDLGDRFARVDLFDLARQQFEKVVREHPDTLAAKKARDRLDNLEEEEKNPAAAAQRRAAKALEQKKAKSGAKDRPRGERPKSKKAPKPEKPKPDEPKPPPPKPTAPPGGGG
jgi:hypothetical protein